jgi:hypothetical protein
MLDSVPSAHQNASFWLDVIDKFIKFLALLVGGAWTWLNFKRSRTYAKKLDLQLVGAVFRKQNLSSRSQQLSKMQVPLCTASSSEVQPAKFSPLNQTCQRNSSDYCPYLNRRTRSNPVNRSVTSFTTVSISPRMRSFGFALIYVSSPRS